LVYDLNYFNFTLSVTPDDPEPLFGAIESNSSKKITQGVTFLAFSNISLILASLEPIYLFYLKCYLLSISGPFIEKKFNLNSF
jgi:hypothetical protein